MKNLMIIPLMFCLLLVSCTEDETSSDFQPSLTGGVQMKKYDTFGDVKTNLFKFANETVTGMYPVSFECKTYGGYVISFSLFNT